MTRITKVIFFMIISICFIAPAFAEIYRTVDKDGVVTYSDQPTVKAEVINLPPANISSSGTPSALNNPADKNVVSSKSSYQLFTISEPKDNATFQNAESISVTAEIQPALIKGDMMQLIMDGMPILQKQAGLQFSIPKVIGDKTILARGAHALQVILYNQNQQEIMRTQTITINVHYASIQNPTVGP